jgi:ABC-type proline/glycine betaine transport system permease subunit
MDRLSGLDWITGLIVSAILGLIPAFIAWKKGRSSFAFWLFGMLFSIIIALPFTIFMKQDQSRLDRRR